MAAASIADVLPMDVFDRHILTDLPLDSLLRLSRAARRWRDACAVHIQRRQTALIDALPVCYTAPTCALKDAARTRIALMSQRRRGSATPSLRTPIWWTFVVGGGGADITHHSLRDMCDSVISFDDPLWLPIAVRYMPRYADAVRTHIAQSIVCGYGFDWFQACGDCQCACLRANGIGCLATLCACHDGGVAPWRLRVDKPGYIKQSSPSLTYDGIDVVTLVQPTVAAPRHVVDAAYDALPARFRVDGDDTLDQRWARLMDSLDDALTRAATDDRDLMPDVVEPLWLDVDASFVGMIRRAVERYPSIKPSDSILARFRTLGGNSDDEKSAE